VEVEHRGAREVLLADAEVVVCAGAIESPKLLLLSGLGDPGQLQEFGIPPHVALPGVGANLHDHTVTPLVYACERAVPPPSPGSTLHQAHLFWRSRDGYPAPDLQPLMFNVPLYPDGIAGPTNAFTLFPGHVRPASRGTVRLASADPDALPAVDPGYLTCPADVDALLAGVRLCRQIAAQPAITRWGAREIFPGADVAADEDLRRYIRQHVITYHHPVGTCRMGVDDLAVVDPELRVYGTSGLRVADASIMPAVTTGNTMAPTNMIGERAADLIAGSLRGAKPQLAVL
jgi:choline dehydrogenase